MEEFENQKDRDWCSRVSLQGPTANSFLFSLCEETLFARNYIRRDFSGKTIEK